MANLRTNNLCGEGGRNAIDGSVFFDGISKLSVPNSADVRLGSNDFTIEAWVKFGSPAGDWDTILGMWDASNTRRTYTLQRKNSDGHLYLYVSPDGGSSNWAFANGGNLTTGDWHHVAGVRDGNTLRVYINGVEVDNSSFSGTVYNNTTDALFIGDVEVTDTNNFNGYISNVRICNGHCLYPNGTTFTPPAQKLTSHYIADDNKTVLLCCQDSDNPLQEATGKTITGYGRHADSSVELVTNPSFNNGTTGWTLSDANEGSMAVVNGSLVLTNDDSSDPPVYAWQAVTTVIGQKYELKVHFSGGTGTPGSNLAVYLNNSSSFGGDAGGFMTADSVGANGIKTMQFTATVSTTYVLVRVNANAAGTSIFSTVSIKAADYGDAPKVIPPYGVDAGNTFDGAISMNSPSYMYFPNGRTEERGRGRALFVGGYAVPQAGAISEIYYSQIQSTGTVIDFGDLTASRWIPSSGASSTRGLFTGGGTPSRSNVMDFVTIATTANAIDFGDLITIRTYHAGFSNSTRAISGGGNNGSVNLNSIEFLTIASAGNGTDFGDISQRSEVVGDSSPTRGLFMGGSNPSQLNTVEFITIATTGNAQDFGDLTTATASGGALSSNTRALYAGGGTPTRVNTIEFFTIATAGNATNFGDLITAKNSLQGCTSNNVRGVFVAGFINPGTNTNAIEHVTIATTGNAEDFGDLVYRTRGMTATSDSHGGLS